MLPATQDSVASPAMKPAQALEELKAVDRAVYAAIADTPTPSLDEPLRRLSNAANYSGLWIAIATLLAAFGGRRGRRAAASGLIAIGVTSAIVNQGVKRAYPRRRPDRDGEEVAAARRVRMPDSTSFPSGHSASGFAFAAAAGRYVPELGAPLRIIATAVAYSRVHTGVHYPGDAVIGSVIGASIGSVVVTATDQVLRKRARRHADDHQ